MKMPLYKSFGCAFRGFWEALKSERNLKIHLGAAVIAAGAGIYLGLSAVEWGLVIFAMGFVITSELFNTATEKMGDAIAGGIQTEGIRIYKDIAAAAVLIAAVTALVIGVVILIIPLVQKVFGG